MKKYIGLILALLLVAVTPTTATAVNMDNMTIDSFTGEVVYPDEEQTVTADTIYIGDNCIYSASTGYFNYAAGSIPQAIVCSVADGMITNEAVVLLIDEGVSYTVYRDGEPYQLDGEALTQPGNYVVAVSSNFGGSERPLSFTIVGEVTSSVRSYTMPMGFAVSSVQFEGSPVNFDVSLATFTEEGSYLVDYVCLASGVNYRLEIVTDYTAPVLALEGVKEGKIRGPVDLSDAEPGSSVTILRDGKEMSYTEELTESGRYDVTITDEAGNSNTYSFVILLYLNTTAILLCIMLVALLAVLAVYLFRKSRRMKVR